MTTTILQSDPELEEKSCEVTEVWCSAGLFEDLQVLLVSVKEQL